jgi:hypothetical protein
VYSLISLGTAVLSSHRILWSIQKAWKSL